MTDSSLRASAERLSRLCLECVYLWLKEAPYVTWTSLWYINGTGFLEFKTCFYCCRSMSRLFLSWELLQCFECGRCDACQPESDSMLFVNRLKDAKSEQFTVPLEERTSFWLLTFNNAVLNRFVWKILFSDISSLFIPQLLQRKPVSVGRLRSRRLRLTHVKTLLSAQLQTRLPTFRMFLFCLWAGKLVVLLSWMWYQCVYRIPSHLPHLRREAVSNSGMGSSGVFALKTNWNCFGALICCFFNLTFCLRPLEL